MKPFGNNTNFQTILSICCEVFYYLPPSICQNRMCPMIFKNIIKKRNFVGYGSMPVGYFFLSSSAHDYPDTYCVQNFILFTYTEKNVYLEEQNILLITTHILVC
jgi:hypothetical protein